jgi:type VI secretion system ImpC/EvpB family protein
MSQPSGRPEAAPVAAPVELVSSGVQSATPAPATAAGERNQLLDAAIATSSQNPTAPDSSLALFINETHWVQKLARWFGAPALQKQGWSVREILRAIERDIARIDRLVGHQLNEILHHEKFQRLEASWRGLAHLVECKSNVMPAPINILVWNVTWAELRNDQEGNDFDQSQFFKKVYEEGIGTPGANPMSALLLDFDIHPRPSRQHPYDDIGILRSLSETAANALTPIFVGASPSIFGVDEFGDLRQNVNYESLFERLDYVSWRQFRESEESRFVSVMLPRMLMRRPYRPQHDHDFGFPFLETPTQRHDMLWGSPVYGVGEVLIRNFGESRWFAEIRGVTRGVGGGGLVLGPTFETFETEHNQVAPKQLTDATISDAFERELARLGFMALCPCKDTPNAAFYSAPSIQKPRKYFDQDATANAELMALNNYTLCSARFGHYIKVMVRDKIGSNMDPHDLQIFLSDWLVNYINTDPEAIPAARAQRPLMAASVQIRARPGRAGEYDCVLSLQPYHSFDDVHASLKLDMRLVSQPSKT